ncbi:ABC transporter permease subunit [Limnoglobus roseus]|uniref:ABC transporter permease n=1 Tax=Limnoglobus roseus TaxID=2598579 RepID=A0A5C1AA65_9BACT|nr:ABC transporter permease subunit [Limnoglobus roseus]QEL14712.1 ABC transporter permease [Limnoglobus roseus]
MNPPRPDIERYTPLAAVPGVLALAALFYFWWLAPVAVGLFTLACLSDTRKLYLFGPFLQLELRRMTRRVRNHLWRPLIALGAGVPLLVLYFVMTYFPAEERPPPDKAAMIATGGFLFVFWFIFILTMSVLTTYMTYAVAEDRESKRLDFILATDLRDRELVIGKMFARILGLLAYPASALPVVLLLPILFKVEPALIFYVVGYAGMTLVSIAGLSGLGSVLATTKKTGGNIFAMVFLPYLFLIFFASQLRFLPNVWFFPGSPGQPSVVSVGDLIEWLSIGNPLALGIRWVTVGLGGGLSVVADDFPAYAAFHTVVGGFAFLYAAYMVRRAAANRGEVVNPSDQECKVPAKRKPVTEWPVMWKEAYCHPTVAKARENRRASRLGVVVLMILPAILFLAAAVSDLFGYQPVILEVARHFPMFVAWIAIMSVGRFGLESIARERERDTLLMLVCTPLPPEEIIRQKFWGLIWLMRGSLLWQLGVGIPAVLCGAYRWWAYPCLVVLQVLLAFVMAAYGLLVSANSPNVETAARRFGLRLVFTVVPVMMVSLLAYAALNAWASWFKYAMLTMLLPLGLLGIGNTQLAVPAELPYWGLAFLAGVVLYALLGWWIWRRAVRRFVRACDPTSDTGPMLDNRAA